MVLSYTANQNSATSIYPFQKSIGSRPARDGVIREIKKIRASSSSAGFKLKGKLAI